jgi:plastocyanin
MRLSLPLVLLLIVPVTHAATLVVNVQGSARNGIKDAVVYAVPEGRKLPLANRTAIMDQKNRTFVPHILPVQVGTAVSFPNSDEIHHQVYSFSAPKSFQLPLYKGTPAKPVLFDKTGVVAVGCNIHDRMSAYIVVVDTPYFALTPRNGRVEFRNLSEGTYAVRVWTAGGGDEAMSSTVALESTERKEITLLTRRKRCSSAPFSRSCSPCWWWFSWSCRA